MEKPTPDKNESQEDSYSTGTTPPVPNQMPKGATDSWSVPGGAPDPNPNVIPG